MDPFTQLVATVFANADKIGFVGLITVVAVLLFRGQLVPKPWLDREIKRGDEAEDSRDAATSALAAMTELLRAVVTQGDSNGKALTDAVAKLDTLLDRRPSRG